MRNDDAHDWRRNGCVFFADAPDLAELGLPLLVLGADSGTFTNAAAMQRETEEAGGRFELLHCLHWPLTECRPAVEAALIRWAQQF